MENQIYLIRGEERETYPEFSKRILSAAKMLREDIKVSVTLTESKPPTLSVIPFRKNKIAAVSVSTPIKQVLEQLADIPGFAGAYKVDKAFPIKYRRNWDPGTVTPGLCLLTLFRKKKNLNHDTFIHRWHNGHTPLTLEVHPIYHYNRNVILETLTPDSEPFDGIVEEHVEKPSLLFNPARFFGGPLKMPWNMLRVYRDVNSFLDYKSIEPYLCREYVMGG
ncbi:MAG: EthD domain-containing protein [Bacteroidetes bacterium]|nr:EthD domain-containing protein [Bacteroidota bacterium]